MTAPAAATPITSPGGGESFNISPGDSFRVGYDFTIPGNGQPVTVKWTNPKAVVNFTCAGGGSGSFTINMPDYTVTVSDGQWYPSGDQQSSLVYQGSITAPDGCGGGGVMHQSQIATFTADVTSSPSNVSLHYRFHDVDNNASGSWSSTESVTTGPLTQSIQGEIYQCVSGSPTTTLVSGGTIAVPAAGLSSSNPLAPTQVAAGTYTMNATAPAGSTFVACGQTGVTITTSTSAHQDVTVPTGGNGDGKFYVTPTSSRTGYVEICKSNANGVTGSFDFTFNGTTVTVPAGACSAAVQVPAGTLLVHEVSTTGFVMASASTIPTSRLVSVNTGQQNVQVTIVAGNISTQTIVNVVNKRVAGTLKICQVAGAGIAVGTSFTFDMSPSGQTVTVPAGNSPGGTCVVVPGTFEGGQDVTITQVIPSGDSVTSIKVGPTNRLVGTATLSAGKVTVVIGSGVTEVTYTDKSRSS